MPAPRLSSEEFQQRVTDRFPESKLVVLSYEHSHKPVDVCCGRCGGHFQIRADTLLKNGQCPTCDPASATKQKNAKERAEAISKSSLITVGEPELNDRGQYRYVFSCAKHGRFTLNKLSGCEVRCPRCHKNLPPTHPDLIPRHRRGASCSLYLLEVRDSVGTWIKVGISTNLPHRLRMYKNDGVLVLRHIRDYRTTLYRANWIEMELKKWARRQLGRRAQPRKKWSGWSESFRDPAQLLVQEFDRRIALDMGRSD